MLWPALVLSATAGSQLTCSECAVVQEGIFNALKYNLSYYEQAAVVGTQETVTLEVGQVIWRMCEVCAGGVHTLAKRPSEAEGHTRTIAVPTAPCAIHSPPCVAQSEPWKSVRYSETVEAACREFTRTHLDLATHEWKEKSADEYHDPALALRMKRKVCTLPDVDACSFDDMLDGYISPTDECALCEAIVHDLEKSVRTSRDAGAKPKSDPYFRLVAIMSQVCNELPMRHTIPKEVCVNHPFFCI